MRRTNIHHLQMDGLVWFRMGSVNMHMLYEHDSLPEPSCFRDRLAGEVAAHVIQRNIGLLGERM